MAAGVAQCTIRDRRFQSLETAGVRFRSEEGHASLALRPSHPGTINSMPVPSSKMPHTSMRPAEHQGPQSQTLLFDADDTLWENNIYFERAITAFISYLDHRVHTNEEVRGHLNAVERSTIAEHGYGLKSFRRSLVICFEQLTHSPITDERHRRIVSFVDSIADQQIELLPGVAETLAQLSQRHRLLVVTKGDVDEQTYKLKQSGLHGFFSGVEVLAEKSEMAYRNLAAQHRCESETTWMIGNSPRSDINPALAAGFNAVFIPHDYTWVLEHETIGQPPPDRELLELGSFPELLLRF
jgi:putative hydrolase of the HAD superfamily